MANDVHKLFQKNHNTINDKTNTNISILNAKISENKYVTDKLRIRCATLSSIIERLKFLRKYVSNIYINKEKKKIRSIYHIFKETINVNDHNYRLIQEYIPSGANHDISNLHSHIWDYVAGTANIPKNTCYSLWCNSSIMIQPITPEDDELIQKNSHKIDDWLLFASYIQKSPFLLFKRYKQLTQKNKRDLWTNFEDSRLLDAVKMYGPGKWTLIANFMATKGPKQCMHRYRNKLVEGINTGKWTVEEDNKLVVGVSIFGVGRWSRISEHVGTRNDSQCRERYCNVLDPMIKRSKWTLEEDQKLMNVANAYGEGNWSRISVRIPGRTDAQCRRRYDLLKKIK